MGFAIALGVSWFFVKSTNWTWYGCSVTIPKSECANQYQPLEPEKYYDSSVHASNAAKNRKECTAMDWRWDSATSGVFSPGGFATMYSGGPEDPLIDCLDITTNMSTHPDDSKEIIAIRPPAFINLSMNGKNPKNIKNFNNTVGDIVLDVDSGNLWVKLPPHFNSCNVPDMKTDAWKSGGWAFSDPRLLEASNAPNCFDTLSDKALLDGCSSGKCSSLNACGFIKIENYNEWKDGTNKIYIFIDPEQIIDMSSVISRDTVSIDGEPGEVGEERNFGTDTYGGWMQKYSLNKEAGYNWNSEAINGLGDSKIKVNQGDYFLVVFPHGPNGEQNQENPWPDNVSDFDHYIFGSQYYLYKATQVDTKWLPYSTYTTVPVRIPQNPVQAVTGLGIMPEIKLYNSTLLRYETRTKALWIISVVLFGLALVLFGFGWAMKKTPKEGNIKIEQGTPPQGTPQDTPQGTPQGEKT